MKLKMNQKPSLWAGEQGESVRKQVGMGPHGILSTQDKAQEIT